MARILVNDRANILSLFGYLSSVVLEPIVVRNHSCLDFSIGLRGNPILSSCFGRIIFTAIGVLIFISVFVVIKMNYGYHFCSEGYCCYHFYYHHYYYYQFLSFSCLSSLSFSQTLTEREEEGLIPAMGRSKEDCVESTTSISSLAMSSIFCERWERCCNSRLNGVDVWDLFWI